MKLANITKQTQRAKEFFEDRLAFTVGPVELKEMMEKERNSIEIIDVRLKEYYDKGHIPSALSIPGKDLEMYMNKLSKDKITIVYCYSQQCHLGSKIALVLADKGYPVMELEGGFNEWKNSNFDIVS